MSGDPIIGVVVGHISSSKRELTPHGFRYVAFDGSTYWKVDATWYGSSPLGPRPLVVPEWIRACEERDARPT